jgi:GMP synthase (glutamine-hydrolysing)
LSFRQKRVFSELLSHRITAEEVKAMNPKGIILSGGPNSVYDKGAFSIDPKIFELGIPILGICFHGFDFFSSDAVAQKL